MQTTFAFSIEFVSFVNIVMSCNVSVEYLSLQIVEEDKHRIGG